MSFWMSHTHHDCLGRWKPAVEKKMFGKQARGYRCPECGAFYPLCPQSESAIRNFTLADRDLIEARQRFEKTWKRES